MTTCFKLVIAAGWAIRYSRTLNRVSSANLTFKQFSRWRLNVLTLQFYLFCSRLLLFSSPPSVCFKLNRLRALKKNHPVSHQPNSLLVSPSYSVELSAIWNLCKNQVSLRTADSFPVVASLPSKIAIFRRREATIGNASAVPRPESSILVQINVTLQTGTTLLEKRKSPHAVYWTSKQPSFLRRSRTGSSQTKIPERAGWKLIETGERRELRVHPFPAWASLLSLEKRFLEETDCLCTLK